MSEFGDITQINALNDLSVKLHESVRLMAKYGREYASAERDYKVTLAQTALKLRADDMPVTLIDKVVYGQKSVAEARMKRDIAEVMYTAAKENINSLKLQIRIMDAQINREWNMNGRTL